MNYRYLADRTFKSSARWISRPQRSSGETVNKRSQMDPRLRRGALASQGAASVSKTFSQPPAEGLMWFPGKNFRCAEEGCDKVFKTMRGLAYHWRSHNTPMRYYRCKKCALRSPEKMLVDVHTAVYHPRKHRKNSSKPDNLGQGDRGGTGCGDRQNVSSGVSVQEDVTPTTTLRTVLT